MKSGKKEVTIGFTGHFSAGKSSMINALLGETILPSSPIPTSANIVEIRAGKDKAIYQLNDGTYTEDDHVDEQRIKQLSKMGKSCKQFKSISKTIFCVIK